MTTQKESFRFSGHDTFHCKEQWILKGLQVLEYQNNKDIFKKNYQDLLIMHMIIVEKKNNFLLNNVNNSNDYLF